MDEKQKQGNLFTTTAAQEKTDRVLAATPAPHNRTDTSRAAAASITDAAPRLRSRIYFAIEASVTGLTNEEIADRLDLRIQTVSARVNELWKRGSVHDSGMRRKTSSGRTAKVWQRGGRNQWPESER